MFDISAYAFAAQSVIAPMAGMVVVWNVLLAPFTLGEVLCVFLRLVACVLHFQHNVIVILGRHPESEGHCLS